jgi:hypothetical protein
MRFKWRTARVGSDRMGKTPDHAAGRLRGCPAVRPSSAGWVTSGKPTHLTKLHPKSGLFDFLNFHVDNLAGVWQHQPR